MKKEIEKLSALANEIWAFGELIGMSNAWNRCDENLRVYFANNYRTKSISFGPDDFSQLVEISNYKGGFGAISMPLNYTAEALHNIYELASKSFEALKEKDHAEAIATKEQRRLERIKELQEELNNLK